jgi:tripartite ATP-independent transporter DctM subunit
VSIALTLFCISFLVLLIGGMPVAWAMLSSAVLWMLVSDHSVFMLVVPDRIFQGIDVFILMAIPLFILAGELINAARMTDHLVNMANFVFGWIKGGLAQVNIGASILFSGITGVALGDIATLGRIFIPAMIKHNYPPAYAAAVTAASSIIGPMVPPSLIVIIYGAATGVSIGALFAACIIPGLLIGVLQIVLVWRQAKRRGFPAVEMERSPKKFISVTRKAAIPLMIPVIILVGIMGGLMTPTEAGAVASTYALLVAVFIYKNMSLKEFVTTLRNTAKFSSKLLIIVGCGAVFSWVLAIENVPTMLAELINHAELDSVSVLLIANLFLLFIGMFIDPAAAIILFAPLLSQIVQEVGVDPVHFGVVVILNLNLGLLTPPLGICLFATEDIAKCGIPSLVREVFPFLAIGLVGLIIITYAPSLSLWLPELLGF